MQRLAATMAKAGPNETYKAATEDHAARMLTSSPLLFVYDAVGCAATLGCLKFVLDAGRPPLRGDISDEAFEKQYGLGRQLRFVEHTARVPAPFNIYEGVY